MMPGYDACAVVILFGAADLRWVCSQYFVIVSCCKVLRDSACMYVAHVCFYVCCSDIAGMQGSMEMFVVYGRLLKLVCFISRCEVLYVVYLYSRCDGYGAFCLTCDACSFKCWCMRMMLVSSCRSCTFVCSCHVCIPCKLLEQRLA